MNLPKLDWLQSLPPEALHALRIELQTANREDSLSAYQPYRKQLEFHALGLTKRERMLRAGNQNGKTYCVAHEMAMHLTGLYPDWWPGRRWTAPIVAWAASDTAETTRDNPQRALIGQIDDWGTGAIPRRLLNLNDYGLATGTADLLDYIRVRHVSGGWSLLRFKYYAQGRRKWQGPPVQEVWCDEEPPPDVYDEGLARTIATGGGISLSFTPLLGMSEVVSRFLMEQSEARGEVNMTIHDAEHISAEQRELVIKSFAPHERQARAQGIPTLGSGRIFPVEEELLKVEPFPIPGYWPRICGMDFGWDHPTAAAWLAWDRDTDTIYVYDTYRRREANPAQHASVLRAKGTWIPVAWPHDGLNDTAVGPQLAKQYREQGVNMRPENAKFPPSTLGDTQGSRTSVEAGISAMLERMETGRWKVFSNQNDWFEEFRLYHRKDGKIVKERDDLLSASRYALMDLRYSIVKPRGQTETFAAPPVYDEGMNY